MKKIIASCLSFALILGFLGSSFDVFTKEKSSIFTRVEAIENEISSSSTATEVTEQVGTAYKIYPIPQNITYNEGDVLLNKPVKILLSSAIDEATRTRLAETMEIKALRTTIVEDIANHEVAEDDFTIYLGVYDANDAVYSKVSANLGLTAEQMQKTDAYFLKIDSNSITVIGADTDAVFYGLTTLYHILRQTSDLRVKNLSIYDYADIKSRGFIEGYYGNPWSLEDRIDLMHFGGYYKQNVYFYAPKDDAKHRVQWDTLYTPEELVGIRRLAEAGNQSKTRFVYALHPLSGSNRLRFDTNYEADLTKLKNKFKQVIDQGVRQISILADDFHNPGGPNGLRLVTDMTNWLKEVIRPEYPDMKITLPYVPFDYMGFGNSAEHNSLRNSPENVQIVMTGGKVWGEVSKSFTDRFKANTGRGSFLWINWPCSDNSKNHLIMGGQEIFLHPDVNPDNIEGIMLNPMQFSEASKIAIFAGACYEWNIFQDENEGHQIWHDSFNYVDHGDSFDTTGSIALRELSRHMKNQAMPLSKVRPIQESKVLAPKLQGVRNALKQSTTVEDDTLSEIKIDFFNLLNHAKNYERYTGNRRTYEQIKFFIDNFKDTAEAGMLYIDALKAYQEKSNEAMIEFYMRAKEVWQRSRTYGFNYIDHIEYAEVGVQHIVPFIKEVDKFLSEKVTLALNPDALITSFITNRNDVPDGNIDNVLDGNLATNIIYKNPNTISEGTYVGLNFSKAVTLNNMQFVLGGGRDHFDQAKLQYLDANGVWHDLVEEGTTTSFTGRHNVVQNINVKLKAEKEVYGVRLIATANNTNDSWLEVKEIFVNKDIETEITPLSGEITTEGLSIRSGNLDRLKDGDTTSASEAFFAKDPYVSGDDTRDTTPENAKLILTLTEPKVLKQVKLYQGKSNANDIIRNARLEYQVEGSSDWELGGRLRGVTDEVWNLTETRKIAKVRIVNERTENVWWRVAEFQAFDQVPTDNFVNINYNITKPSSWSVYNNYVEGRLTDNDPSSYVWYRVGNGDTYQIDDALTLDLGSVLHLNKINLIVGNNNGDKFIRYAIEYSEDGNTYTAVPGYDNYTGKSSGADNHSLTMRGQRARYVRVRSLERRHSWVKFSEFTVKASENFNGTSLYSHTNLNEEIFGQEGVGELTLNAKTYSLPSQSFVGLDFKNIKVVDANVSYAENNALKVQYSKDTVTWTDAEAGALTTNAGVTTVALTDKEARYIRIINTGNESTDLDLRSFVVNLPTRPQKTVTSTFSQGSTARDIRTKNNVNMAFDNNLNTFVEVTGVQDSSKEIVFDLGQAVDFRTFRYYVSEGNRDFLRSADFKVLREGTTDEWVTILSIDPGSLDNTWNDDTAKNYPQFTHDERNPGNMYAEAVNLSVRGRLLKIMPKYTYSHRWVQINELLINGGEYLSEEWNKDFTPSAIEKPEHLPTFAIDGNYNTSYIMNSKRGTINYRISEPSIKALRILTLDRPSDTAVTFITHEGDTLEVGKLVQTVHEFVVPADKNIKEVKFTLNGEDTAGFLEIVEIVPIKDAVVATDKAALVEELAKPLNEQWTPSSKRNFAEAHTKATAINSSNYVTQKMVDNALADLVRARSLAKVAVSTDSLRRFLTEAKMLVQEEVLIYTFESFLPYQDFLHRLQSLLDSDYEWSEGEVNAFTEEHTRLLAGLKYSPFMEQYARGILEDLLKENRTNYTEATWSNHQRAIDALNSNISGEDKNPLNYKPLLVALGQTNQALVDISSLKPLVELELNEEEYTPETWSAWQEALNEVKNFIRTGTVKEEVATLLARATTKKNELRNKEPKDPNLLNELRTLRTSIDALEDDDYTIDSMSNLYDELEDVDEENVTLEKINSIKAAKLALVSVKPLLQKKAEILGLNAESYTRSSWSKLTAELRNEVINPYLESGTEVSIQTHIAKLNDFKNKLELRVNEALVREYLKGVKEYASELYSEEVYRPYAEALANIKNAPSQLADLSATAWQNLKTAYETTLLNLYKHITKPFVQVNNEAGLDKNSSIVIEARPWVEENGVNLSAEAIAERAKVKTTLADMGLADEKSLVYYDISRQGEILASDSYTITLPTLKGKKLLKVLHFKGELLKGVSEEENVAAGLLEVITSTTPEALWHEDKEANFVRFKVSSLSPFVLVYEQTAEIRKKNETSNITFEELFEHYVLGTKAEDGTRKTNGAKDHQPKTATSTTPLSVAFILSACLVFYFSKKRLIKTK